MAVATGLAAGAATPLKAEDEMGERAPASMVLFGSLEAGPAKTFAAMGVKRAYGEAGLDGSGFRTLTTFGVAREQAYRTPPRGLATKSEGQALIGYEWRIGETFAAIYAGSDFEIEQRPCGCGMVTTVRFGYRILADLWTTPTGDTMLQASAFASTLDQRIWGRVAAGWAPPQVDLLRSVLPQGFYLGPEIEAYHQSEYDKLRLGLHVTGLRLLGVGWRLSGGWQRTSDRPSAAYATLGLHWRH